ncbi:MAG: phosphatidylglycerol lysyltransferase domain-containing protein [Solirubrobacteraceae bacterium]|nr:phosphatidylglycerol lysyltransferase domain-containing protein [Solirubrobacteraceae bacterium]
MSVAAHLPAQPRVSKETRFALVIAAFFGGVNLLAGLALTPSVHLQAVAHRVDSSRLAPAIAGGPWDLLVAALLFPLAWGLLRRRALAWVSALALLAVVAGLDVWHHEPPIEVAIPVLGIAALVALRRRMVAEPFREALRRHMLPTADAFERTGRLLRDCGDDTLAPFKLRPDVGHLFSDDGDAVIAFRVENRAMLIAGDPVGSAQGADDVLLAARDLARGAGLRFGMTSASEGLAKHLEATYDMKALYLGCEAIVDTATFTLEGKAIKKVRQAHRRIEREGYALELMPLAEVGAEDRAALHRCRTAARVEEQSFSMAPDSLDGPACVDALIAFARHGETGEIAGFIVYLPLRQRSLWSLALQLRVPGSPNGIIDALLVHTLREAKAAGVAEVSLNFATARRYMHEPVTGFWPHVARLLARVAMRWTQIDDLRFHNQKFAPRWEPRYVVVDSVLHLPHIVFAMIWQEGQLPRPDAFLAPAWPLTPADRAVSASS